MTDSKLKIKVPDNICEMCQECIKKQIEQYYGFTDQSGKVYKSFHIDCSYVPKDYQYLTEEMQQSLTEEDKESALDILDPVRWIKKNLIWAEGEYVYDPINLRYYQQDIVRCTGIRKVLRMGRRTGKTSVIAVYTIYRLFTQAGIRIIMVAPQKAHMRELHGRIRDMIYASPMLNKSVVTDLQTPYSELILNNGSRLRSFTAGVSAGAEGKTVRGQDADLILLEEAQYIDSNTIKNAINPILITREKKKTELVAFSTLTGARDFFWEWDQERPYFKSFHYPSWVLPQWKGMEAEMRAEYTQAAWQLEIACEWGLTTEGVYQTGFIDGAKGDYKYEGEAPNVGWVYSFGIDWNTNAGTVIYVVGLHSATGMFRVVDSYVVPKQEWTQLKAMEKIIDLNAVWRPKFIYGDYGHGTTVIEMLQKYGHDMLLRDPSNPAAALKDIVKGYWFASKIEVRDPATGQKREKHAKEFMVENSVRQFENKKIEYSAYDNELYRQLANYMIKKRSARGIPVYEMRSSNIEDHHLDAFNLALVAFKLEHSLFGKRPADMTILIGPSPDKKVLESTGIMNERRSLEKKDTASRSRIPEILSGSRSVLGRGAVPEHRHGWATDTEDIHKEMNRKRRARKQTNPFRRGGFGRSKI